MLSIGILGGVGAIASARFHLDLVTRWAKQRGARTDDDFPRIVHASYPCHLTESGMTDRRTTECAVMASFITHFDRMHGPVAVVCNSIVPILPQNPRILTPVAACRDALKGVRRAALLASESTIRDEIYQRAYPEIDWRLVPATPWIEDAIRGCSFNIGGVGRHPDETIVLGCTELSTQVRTDVQHLSVISPTDEMIRILCLT